MNKRIRTEGNFVPAEDQKNFIDTLNDPDARVKERRSITENWADIGNRPLRERRKSWTDIDDLPGEVSVPDYIKEKNLEKKRDQYLQEAIEKFFKDENWYKNFLNSYSKEENLSFKYGLVDILIEKITRIIHEEYGVNQENLNKTEIEKELGREYNHDAILRQIKWVLRLFDDSSKDIKTQLNEQIKKMITIIVNNKKNTLLYKIKNKISKL